MARKKTVVKAKKKIDPIDQNRKKVKLALLYLAGAHSIKAYEVVQKIFMCPTVDDLQVVSNDNGVNLILKEDL